MPVTVDTKPWKSWGAEAAESRKKFTDLLDEYRDGLMELPLDERQACGDALMSGWIEHAGDILSGARTALESRWEARGREMGAMEAQNSQATDLLALSPTPPDADLATDLRAMTNLNRTLAMESMLIGMIRGYSADVRTRLVAKGGGA